MKVLCMSCFFLFVTCVPFCYPQAVTEKPSEEERRNDPLIFKVRSHEPNFNGFKNKYLRQLYSSGESFYKQKDQWRHIIDSMWGPGLPTAQKLQIFDDYASHIHDEFDGFQSLGMSWASWDSLRAYWRSKITDSTSRGMFSGIMSRFAFSLRDIHTYAWDDTVVQTPLNPGVPILCIGAILDGSIDPMSAAHFGAVITPLPDSNLLVLKVVPSHPLNLQPGDIILGYEGFRWNTLVTELLNMDLPMYYFAAGAESALNHELLISAGMNWHLFDTIDVIKYASHDTLHLSLEPMASLIASPMLNNEQLPVPGVSFPDYYNNQDVSYGTITGTNIGYIYLFIESNVGTGWPPPYADEEFFQAVDALKDKDALIIDLRFNQGGRAFFDAAFDILFNRSLQTLKSALRCNTFDQTLCPMDYHGYTFETAGEPPGFDRPIAVLLGPSCVSFGDITAYRLCTHDMARFFGKSSCGSLGWNQFISSYPGWTIRYSVADQFNLSNPGVYLNRKEFPIDYPVWFNADDVANGIDPVVQKAVEWINNSSYAHDIEKDKIFYQPANDTIKLKARVENPSAHPLSVKAYYRKGEQVLDSSSFYDDGLHNDSLAGDGVWATKWALPSKQGYYNVNVSTFDPVDDKRFLLQNLTSFTNVGPVVIDSMFCTRLPNQFIRVDLWLLNSGSDTAVYEVDGILTTSDPNIKSFGFNDISYGSLEPSQREMNTYTFKVDTSVHCADLNLTLGVKVDDLQYWSYDFTVPVRYAPVPAKNMVDFGVLFPGETKTDSIVIRNSNTLPLNLTSIVSDNPTQYTVLPSTATIAPLDSAMIYITFNPTSYGIHTGHILFSYESGSAPVQVNLTGIYSPPGIQFALMDDWNMVSVPMLANSYDKDSLFPNSNSSAFNYHNGYEIKDTLSNGVGYWIKFVGAQMALLNGTLIINDTFDINIGWNMIGSITYPVAVNSITSNPSGMVTTGFYFYNGTPDYIIKDTIKPGYGYWVKADRAGKLMLSSSTQAIVSNRINIVASDEKPPSPPNSDIPNPKSAIPKEFALEQNYPNPFNPLTIINYQLPIDSWITIKVYNLLGVEIATLVNEDKKVGRYEVEFSAEGGSASGGDGLKLSSGIYFYRLTAGKFIETKKLILMK